MEIKRKKREKEISENKFDKKINKALLKRALGYTAKEVVEEYSFLEDEGAKLTKRKITKKNVPADISAVKILLEILNEKNSYDFSNMTDEELFNERDRLLKLLKESEKDD